MSDTCAKQENELNACCCNCTFHLPDHSHPDIDDHRIVKQKKRAGKLMWVCLAPEMDCVFSEWPEHGLCEMWHDEDVPFVVSAADPQPEATGDGTASDS